MVIALNKKNFSGNDSRVKIEKISRFGRFNGKKKLLDFFLVVPVSRTSQNGKKEISQNGTELLPEKKRK